MGSDTSTADSRARTDARWLRLWVGLGGGGTCARLRAKPDERSWARSRRHASRPGPESLAKRVCRAARARPVKKKRRKAAARRAPTAEEAHRMHAGNPRSSKRHAAPRARAGGHAARSSDCGGEAGGGLGKMGRGAGARRDVDHRLLFARARASGEERLVPTSSRILFHLSRLMAAVPPQI